MRMCVCKCNTCISQCRLKPKQLTTLFVYIDKVYYFNKYSKNLKVSGGLLWWLGCC